MPVRLRPESLIGSAFAEMPSEKIAFPLMKSPFTQHREDSQSSSRAADRQPDEEVKKRGPSIKAAFDEDGNPTRAAQGFARGQHIDPSELIRNALGRRRQ